MANRNTALILCFFFGGFGVHSFYLGRTASGVMRLLFFWTLIPGLIAIFDFFNLAFMSEDTFKKKFGSAGPQSSSAADDLTKLAALAEKNLISPDEFNLKKTELLRKIG